ncbi:hypothetical protein HY933_02575 [Candidatus Falkowbacteria bacterium]|nr:hypothetical protein [Candidatus Falkowbacteria bacterium]
MKLPDFRRSPELTQSDASGWRSYLRSTVNIPEDSAALMDHIAELLTIDDIERKFKEIYDVQVAGNTTYHLDIPPREGFKISAMVELARERGIITAEEKRLGLTVCILA